MVLGLVVMLEQAVQIQFLRLLRQLVGVVEDRGLAPQAQEEQQSLVAPAAVAVMKPLELLPEPEHQDKETLEVTALTVAQVLRVAVAVGPVVLVQTLHRIQVVMEAPVLQHLFLVHLLLTLAEVEEPRKQAEVLEVPEAAATHLGVLALQILEAVVVADNP